MKTARLTARVKSCEGYGLNGKDVEDILHVLEVHAEMLTALKRCVREGDLPLGVDSDARLAIAKGESK